MGCEWAYISPIVCSLSGFMGVALRRACLNSSHVCFQFITCVHVTVVTGAPGLLSYTVLMLHVSSVFLAMYSTARVCPHERSPVVSCAASQLLAL